MDRVFTIRKVGEKYNITAGSTCIYNRYQVDEKDLFKAMCSLTNIYENDFDSHISFVCGFAIEE